MDTEPFAGMPLLTINKDGTAPQTRITKASVLRSEFTRHRDDDTIRAIQRGECQDLLDGGPPYSAEEVEDQPGMSNLNFGGAEQQLERALAPYHDMINADENLVSVSTLFGAEDERDDLNDVLSEELTRTIRDSAGYAFQTTRLAHLHVGFGFGVGYWSDDLDWRHRGDGLGQFYFPAKAVACEDELEFVCSIEEYTVTRLFRLIRDPEAAERSRLAGWSPESIKNAILKATSTEPAYQDWERLCEQIKANDISVANSLPVIRVINGWWKEFSGKITHGMTTESPVDGETFLYCGCEKYRSMQEALVIFPYGLGTNTKLHSLRGLIHKIYAFEQQRNRSLNRLIDQGLLATSVMVQPGDESDLSNLAMQYYGNYIVLEPGVNVVPYVAPDLQRAAMPVINEMERLRNERITGYTADSALDGDQRKTAREVDASLQQSAVLSGSAQDFWNKPFERLLQQVIRRMARRTYVPQDPGGAEIADLHLRLVKRGIPLEALFNLDFKATRFVRAIGSGSASARTLALTRIGGMRERMDDVGQANLDRALAVDAVGAAQANRFFPLNKVKRTTLDTNMAAVESVLLIQGNELPVRSSDKHLAHAQEHIKPLIEAFQAEQEGQIPIEEVGTSMRLLYQHTTEHVDQISGDPASVEQAAAMRQILQQVGEVVSNGLKKAQAAAAKQQEEGGTTEGQAGPSEQDIRDLDKHRQDMEFAQQRHEVSIRQLEETAKTKRSIADADAAAKIARETALATLRKPQK